VENLKNLKRGKSKNRNKSFRKKLAPWSYRKAVARIEQLAQENRVRLEFVDPRNTSRRCPICSTAAKENRKGERFLCVVCGYSADSDHVGAQNVIAKTFGNYRELMVPDLQESKSYAFR